MRRPVCHDGGPVLTDKEKIKKNHLFFLVHQRGYTPHFLTVFLLTLIFMLTASIRILIVIGGCWASVVRPRHGMILVQFAVSAALNGHQ